MANILAERLPDYPYTNLDNLDNLDGLFLRMYGEVCCVVWCVVVVVTTVMYGIVIVA